MLRDILKERRFWSQKEVLAIGRQLGIKHFQRQNLAYWIKQGVFPPPRNRGEKNSPLTLYASVDVLNGFNALCSRLVRFNLSIDEVTILNAMHIVRKHYKDETANYLRSLLKEINE